MQLFIITRGVKRFVDDWIRLLQGKFLPYTGMDSGAEKGKGKVKKLTLQVGVRPVQLWEIAFPEEHKDIMLKTILGENNSLVGKKYSKWLGWLRKLMKIKPIPEYKKDLQLPLPSDNVGVTGIGVKYDEYWKDEDGKEYERI